MGCDKCEKKKEKTLITSDVWKEGQQNQQSQKQGKVSSQMILPGYNKRQFDPIGVKCMECKKRTIPKDEKLCQQCAYTKGCCKICGIKILDIKFYKQSNV